jgi:hypothetical protein
MKSWRIAFIFCCIVATHAHAMEPGAQSKRIVLVVHEPSCGEGYYIFTTKGIQYYPSGTPTHKKKISVRQVDAIYGLLRLTNLPPKNGEVTQ